MDVLSTITNDLSIDSDVPLTDSSGGPDSVPVEFDKDDSGSLVAYCVIA